MNLILNVKDKYMIPKVIHYVWLGDKPKPKKIEKCIASWKKYCPDYKIIEWNEQNFDISSHPFLKEAYDAGNYAFASDIIRLIVLLEQGGVYVDADVEFVKNIDPLLQDDCFIGFETDDYVNSGQIFGSVPDNQIVKEHLAQYDDLSFKNCEDIHSIACPVVFTELLKQYGLVCNGTEQNICNVHIYPIEYFNPFEVRTGKMKKTENSYSIHWSAHSWVSMNVVTKKIVQICHRLFGMNCFDWLKKIKGVCI